jgi:hypothetical protein
MPHRVAAGARGDQEGLSPRLGLGLGRTERSREEGEGETGW